MKFINNSMFGSIALLIVFLASWQWGPGLLGMPEFVLPKLSRGGEEGLVMGEDAGVVEEMGVVNYFGGPLIAWPAGPFFQKKGWG